MTIDEVQIILDQSYPKIKEHYGKGNLDYPTIDTSYKNTYAMHSGEPEAEGEHSETSIAEYNRGIIYLYLPNITNTEGILRALIHEYTHYKQDHKLFKQYRAMYSYDENPIEIEAHKNEEDWQLFI